jgi:hypothetical protein
MGVPADQNDPPGVAAPAVVGVRSCTAVLIPTSVDKDTTTQRRFLNTSGRLSFERNFVQNMPIIINKYLLFY